MKKVGITQRVEHIESYGESRDCLDQKWSELLLELGYMPVPLPTVDPKDISSLLEALNLDSIIFSGGNSLTVLDKSASDASPRRDAFETALLNKAISNKLNILGVCRGMQMINMHLGGSLSKVKGHVALKHSITTLDNKYQFSETVNSYHNWAIGKENLAIELKALAKDEDGNIEAFSNEEKKILGIMWHPERENPFDPNDIKLIKRFL